MIIKKALKIATDAHAGQKRKYTFEDYINHPIRVSEMVGLVGGDEDMVAAALLHDVVEDTNLVIGDIEDMFGMGIGGMVADMTSLSKRYPHLSRPDRKYLDRYQASKIPNKSKIIRLADILDNVPSIIEYDPDFAPIYIKEKKAMMFHLRGAHDGLYARAATLLGLHF